MSTLDHPINHGTTGMGMPEQEQERQEHTAMKRYIEVVRKNDALEKVSRRAGGMNICLD